MSKRYVSYSSKHLLFRCPLLISFSSPHSLSVFSLPLSFPISVCSPTCGSRACSAADPNLCCDQSCIGGCTGTTAKDCVACVNVEHQGSCLNRCPVDEGIILLDFLDRRCITSQECLQKKPEKSSNSKSTHYHLVNVTDKQHKCLLECPPNSEEDPLDSTRCKICYKNRCPKVCAARVVRNIADVQRLRGCVKVEGNLDIDTRGAGNIVHELEENLKDIEVITGCLKIVHSPSLVTLHFFSKLQTIEGNTLDRGKYSLVILDNPNLRKLFPANHTVEIKRGKGFFHINPKLCPAEIEEVQKHALDQPWDASDVSMTTNGDRIECSVVDFKVTISPSKSVIHQASQKTTAVIINWQNMAHAYADYRHLLGYTIYYRKAPHNITKYEGRDACAKNEWNSQDANPDSIHDNNLTAMLPLLSFYTRYALYIETIGIESKTKAESELIYFTTPEGIPSEPTNIRVNHTTSNSLTVTWSPPINPRGLLHSYLVELTYVPTYSDVHPDLTGKLREKCISEGKLPPVFVVDF